MPKSKSLRDERSQRGSQSEHGEGHRRRKHEERRDRSDSRDATGDGTRRSESDDHREKSRHRKEKHRRHRKDEGSTRGIDDYEPTGGKRSELGQPPKRTFSNQVASSGFTQFPGQMDGVMPGGFYGAPTPPQVMSASPQAQFPGQMPPLDRPPLAITEGGPGLAADYYEDGAVHVELQPGVRPPPPEFILGEESGLQPALPVEAPPPEPSSLGQVGLAASYFSPDMDFPSPTTTGFNQSTPNSASRPGPAPQNNAFQSASAPTVPTLGTAAAVAAGAIGEIATGASTAPQSQPQRPESLHTSSGSAAEHRPHSSDQRTTSQNVFSSESGGQARPGKSPTRPSNMPLYATGAAGAAGLASAAYHHRYHSSEQSGFSSQPHHPMAMAHRNHPRGPLEKFVDFWKDPDGVAKFEEYTEAIGVCRYCFAPGSSPLDAPRKHRYGKRRSNERLGSSMRVDKDSRYYSSEHESRRKSGKSWLATGIAGYGLAQMGKNLFSTDKDFDDTYSVRMGKRNSISPDRGSRTSRGVTYRSSNHGSKHRSRSRERVEVEVAKDGNVYKKVHHAGHNEVVMKSYSAGRRARSRSRSADRMPMRKGNGLTEAALGAALGSAAVVSTSRKHSTSPQRAYVRSRRRSREHNPENRASNNIHHSPSSSYAETRKSRQSSETGVFGDFFSAPSERRKERRHKTRTGFFNLSNGSSSSSDADLAFNGQHSRSKTQKTSTRDDRKAEAALLGLGAATAALAATQNGRKPKQHIKPDLIAVKERKGKGWREDLRKDKAKRSSSSEVLEEDLWESASEEDNVSVDSALAYGLHRTASQESMRSESSSGTSKWGWRWGRKERKRPEPQNNSFVPGIAALGVAGGAAGIAMMSDDRLSNTAMASTNNLPPLQQVYPIPTSDPSRFDVTGRSSSISNQALMTSQPAPIPLQQPQPMAPVSSSVYATQAPYEPSYGAPSGPPVFSQMPYPPPYADYSAGAPYNYSQVSIPGSFPHQGIAFDLNSGDAGITDSLHRRDTSPLGRIAGNEKSHASRRRRRHTDDEATLVRFDMTKEQEEKEREERRRERREAKKHREEVYKHEKAEAEEIEREKRASAPEPETMDETKLAEERDFEKFRSKERESQVEENTSWVAPAAAGLASAAIAATVVTKESSKVDERREKRRKERRIHEGTENGSPGTDERRDFETGFSKDSSLDRKEAVHKQAATNIRKTPSYEDYSSFFVPDLSSSTPGRRNIDAANGDNEIATYQAQVPDIVTIEPRDSKSIKDPAAYTYNGEVAGLDPERMMLPWQVPRLNLIKPTPPGSMAGSVRGQNSPDLHAQELPDPEPEQDLEISSQAGQKVSFGEPQTHEYDVITPDEQHEEFFTSATEQLRNDQGNDIQIGPRILEIEPKVVEIKPSSTRNIASTHMPGQFGDDIDFAATVAAGLQHTGFDPSIAIEDPGFRRRDSPSGSDKGSSFYQQPTVQTVTDLGTTVKDISMIEPGEANIESPGKRSNKANRRREKFAKRQVEDDWSRQSTEADAVEEHGQHTAEPMSVSLTPSVDVAAEGGSYSESVRSKDGETPAPHREATEVVADPTSKLVDRKKSKKKSKRRDTDVDDTASSKSSLKEADEPTASSNTDKKKSLFGILSLAMNQKAGSTGSKDLPTEATLDDFVEPKRKPKISKSRKGKSDEHGDEYGQVVGSTNDLRRYGDGDDQSNALDPLQKQRSNGKQDAGEALSKFSAGDVEQPDDQDHNHQQQSESFLGERPVPPPPPDNCDRAAILGVSEGQNSASYDDYPQFPSEEQTEARYTRLPESLPTSPTSADRKNFKAQPSASAAASASHTSTRHARRLSSVDTDSANAVPSPTAVPLHFRRSLITSNRSSPTISPVVVSQPPTPFPPRQKGERPRSTEFKSSKEFRPLWLVERHNSRQGPAPEEVYPSLPSSRSTSRSSSVHVVDDGAHGIADQETVGKASVFDYLVHDFKQSHDSPPNVIDSKETRPTVASFHVSDGSNAGVIHQSRASKTLAEENRDSRDVAKQMLRGNAVASPLEPVGISQAGSSLLEGASLGLLAGGLSLGAVEAVHDHESPIDNETRREPTDRDAHFPDKNRDFQEKIKTMVSATSTKQKNSVDEDRKIDSRALGVFDSDERPQLKAESQVPEKDPSHASLLDKDRSRNEAVDLVASNATEGPVVSTSQTRPLEDQSAFDKQPNEQDNLVGLATEFQDPRRKIKKKNKGKGRAKSEATWSKDVESLSPSEAASPSGFSDDVQIVERGALNVFQKGDDASVNASRDINVVEQDSTEAQDTSFDFAIPRRQNQKDKKKSLSSEDKHHRHEAEFPNNELLVSNSETDISKFGTIILSPEATPLPEDVDRDMDDVPVKEMVEREAPVENRLPVEASKINDFIPIMQADAEAETRDLPSVTYLVTEPINPEDTSEGPRQGYEDEELDYFGYTPKNNGKKLRTKKQTRFESPTEEFITDEIVVPTHEVEHDPSKRTTGTPSGEEIQLSPVRALVAKQSLQGKKKGKKSKKQSILPKYEPDTSQTASFAEVGTDLGLERESEEMNLTIDQDTSDRAMKVQNADMSSTIAATDTAEEVRMLLNTADDELATDLQLTRVKEHEGSTSNRSEAPNNAAELPQEDGEWSLQPQSKKKAKKGQQGRKAVLEEARNLQDAGNEPESQALSARTDTADEVRQMLKSPESTNIDGLTGEDEEPIDAASVMGSLPEGETDCNTAEWNVPIKKKGKKSKKAKAQDDAIENIGMANPVIAADAFESLNQDESLSNIPEYSTIKKSKKDKKNKKALSSLSSGYEGLSQKAKPVNSIESPSRGDALRDLTNESELDSLPREEGEISHVNINAEDQNRSVFLIEAPKLALPPDNPDDFIDVIPAEHQPLKGPMIRTAPVTSITVGPTEDHDLSKQVQETEHVSLANDDPAGLAEGQDTPDDVSRMLGSSSKKKKKKSKKQQDLAWNDEPSIKQGSINTNSALELAGFHEQQTAPNEDIKRDVTAQEERFEAVYTSVHRQPDTTEQTQNSEMPGKQSISKLGNVLTTDNFEDLQSGRDNEETSEESQLISRDTELHVPLPELKKSQTFEPTSAVPEAMSTETVKALTDLTRSISTATESVDDHVGFQPKKKSKKNSKKQQAFDRNEEETALGVDNDMVRDALVSEPAKSPKIESLSSTKLEGSSEARKELTSNLRHITKEPMLDVDELVGSTGKKRNKKKSKKQQNLDWDEEPAQIKEDMPELEQDLTRDVTPPETRQSQAIELTKAQLEETRLTSKEIALDSIKDTMKAGNGTEEFAGRENDKPSQSESIAAFGWNDETPRLSEQPTEGQVQLHSETVNPIEISSRQVVDQSIKPGANEATETINLITKGSMKDLPSDADSFAELVSPKNQGENKKQQYEAQLDTEQQEGSPPPSTDNSSEAITQQDSVQPIEAIVTPSTDDHTRRAPPARDNGNIPLETSMADHGSSTMDDSFPGFTLKSKKKDKKAKKQKPVTWEDETAIPEEIDADSYPAAGHNAQPGPKALSIEDDGPMKDNLSFDPSSRGIRRESNDGLTQDAKLLACSPALEHIQDGRDTAGSPKQPIDSLVLNNEAAQESSPQSRAQEDELTEFAVAKKGKKSKRKQRQASLANDLEDSPSSTPARSSSIPPEEVALISSNSDRLAIEKSVPLDSTSVRGWAQDVSRPTDSGVEEQPNVAIPKKGKKGKKFKRQVLDLRDPRDIEPSFESRTDVPSGLEDVREQAVPGGWDAEPATALKGGENLELSEELQNQETVIHDTSRIRPSDPQQLQDRSDAGKVLGTIAGASAGIAMFGHGLGQDPGPKSLAVKDGGDAQATKDITEQTIINRSHRQETNNGFEESDAKYASSIENPKAPLAVETSRYQEPQFSQIKSPQESATSFQPRQSPQHNVRDSGIHLSDSPLLNESVPLRRQVRDSGYQGTETSPLVTDPETPERRYTLHDSTDPEAGAISPASPGIEDIASSDRNIIAPSLENPLSVSIEVDPGYDVSISRVDASRGRTGPFSQPQEDTHNQEPRQDQYQLRSANLDSPVRSLDDATQPSPVDSTTKDRSSVLFQSSPSTRDQLEHSLEPRDDSARREMESDRAIQPPVKSPSPGPRNRKQELPQPSESLQKSSRASDIPQDGEKSLFGGPVGINSDQEWLSSPPRSPFGFEASARRRLDTINEYISDGSPIQKKSRAVSDVGSPERGVNAKAARRSATPLAMAQIHESTPATEHHKGNDSNSMMDPISRLPWPAVDEDNHRVDLERSRSRNLDNDRRPSSRHSNISALASDPVKQRENEQRSLSGASIRSSDSINAIIRTPENVRSGSVISNRSSGTPPLRRVNRSVSGDLRAASKRGGAKLSATGEGEAEREAEFERQLERQATDVPSSSTFDPIRDKGKGRVRDMADVYVSRDKVAITTVQ